MRIIDTVKSRTVGGVVKRVDTQTRFGHLHKAAPFEDSLLQISVVRTPHLMRSYILSISAFLLLKFVPSFWYSRHARAAGRNPTCCKTPVLFQHSRYTFPPLCKAPSRTRLPHPDTCTTRRSVPSWSHSMPQWNPHMPAGARKCCGMRLDNIHAGTTVETNCHPPTSAAALVGGAAGGWRGNPRR